MKTTIRVVLLLVVAALGIGGWSLYSRDTTTAKPLTAVVTRGTVEETVLASGTIQARQLVSVGARVSGQIETMAVTLGQNVQQGDLIAEIDSQDQQNDVLQAKADLANIEAQIAAKKASLRNAELTLARQEKLGTQNLASQETVEAATSEVQVAQAELEALAAQKSSAEVMVSTAQVALDRTRITAPVSGTVVAIVVDEGQTVNATQSAPTLVKIADLDTMVVKAEISEADVVHVQPGQAVVFTILGDPNRPFTAVVREVEPAPSEIEDSDTISTDEAIYYNALLEVANPDHLLRIGMTTQVSIILDKAENVLTVPASALHTSQEGATVEVYDPASGATETRAVEVGLNDKVSAEITSGLNEGETVVTGTAIAAATSQSGNGMPPPMGL